jgi:pentatricopeptide repeat protein
MEEGRRCGCGTSQICHSISGDLGRARHFFDVMPEWNLVPWNEMLGAYASGRMLTEARDLFDAMLARNGATYR